MMAAHFHALFETGCVLGILFRVFPQQAIQLLLGLRAEGLSDPVRIVFVVVFVEGVGPALFHGILGGPPRLG